jgi:hypothetical protein
MKTEAQIRHQYEQIRGALHERARREWAGAASRWRVTKLSLS